MDDSDVIKIKSVRRIDEESYDIIWKNLSIDEDTFYDYKGLYVVGNLYQTSIDDAVRSFMENYKTLKRDLGEEIDKSEESVRKFLNTPIGNGNLKKGYIPLEFWNVMTETGSIKKIVQCYILLEVTSNVPFTYGMVLLANSYGIQKCDIGYSYPTGGKIGLAEDYFVFELFTQ